MPAAPFCLPSREVTRSKVAPPEGACDSHAHVFGPADRFPYAEDRSYTPPDAPLKTYSACSIPLALRAACWCRAAPMGATIQRCWMR